MQSITLSLCLTALALGQNNDDSDPPPFELNNGDQVVFLGNTFFERSQASGYIETALTSRFPGRQIVFRNLGWSGDTVFGHARAGFGSVADGFKELKDQVEHANPTVIFLAYGMNASFEGPAGLSRFLDGLNTLIDTLAPANARIILVSPIRHEKMPPPLPDPTPHNKNLRLYIDAMKSIAAKRGFLFIDLYELLGDGLEKSFSKPLTDNGIHLTPIGYWHTAQVIEQALRLDPREWRVQLSAGGNEPNAVGTEFADVNPTSEGIRFTITDAMLPPPPRPPSASEIDLGQRPLVVSGLKPGRYTLEIDGVKVANADAKQWADGVSINRGPEFDQAERLRKTIIEKNTLYFHRWRPQNITYLFLFRKHEQGQNAKEIPQFDPLVAEKEKEILKLAIPVAHRYRLFPQTKEGK